MRNINEKKFIIEYDKMFKSFVIYEYISRSLKVFIRTLTKGEIKTITNCKEGKNKNEINK